MSAADMFSGTVGLLIGFGLLFVAGVVMVTWIIFPFLVIKRLKAHEALLTKLLVTTERCVGCHDATATNTHAIAKLMLEEREARV